MPESEAGSAGSSDEPGTSPVTDGSWALTVVSKNGQWFQLSQKKRAQGMDGGDGCPTL